MSMRTIVALATAALLGLVPQHPLRIPQHDDRGDRAGAARWYGARLYVPAPRRDRLPSLHRRTSNRRRQNDELHARALTQRQTDFFPLLLTLIGISHLRPTQHQRVARKGIVVSNCPEFSLWQFIHRDVRPRVNLIAARLIP